MTADRWIAIGAVIVAALAYIEAFRSRRAARDSAAAADRSATAAERANVSVEAANGPLFAAEPQPGDGTICTFLLRNVGRGQARQLQVTYPPDPTRIYLAGGTDLDLVLPQATIAFQYNMFRVPFNTDDDDFTRTIQLSWTGPGGHPGSQSLRLPDVPIGSGA